jgi:hypothetical protein
VKKLMMSVEERRLEMLKGLEGDFALLIQMLKDVRIVGDNITEETIVALELASELIDNILEGITNAVKLRFLPKYSSVDVYFASPEELKKAKTKSEAGQYM